jgi:hydrogenase maturation protease
MTARNVLVAGIGNVFLGDDGFGVEVVAHLARRSLPEGVEVADYGIRGFDLAYALMECDAAIIVDAIPRDKPPGSLFVLQPVLDGEDDEQEVVNAHGMNPMEVFRLVRRFGGTLPPTYLVGCQPGTFDPEDEGAMELTPEVAAAALGAADLVESLLPRLLATPAETAPASRKES